MKPSITRISVPLIGIVICLINQIAVAQWSVSGNNLTGANSSSPNEFIGTVNNYNLRFKTNSTTRMTLSVNGSLGIGTTTPANRLEVNGGNINTSGTYKIGNVEILKASGANLRIGGTSLNLGIGTLTPVTKLQIIGGSDAEPAKGGYLTIGDTTGENLVLDNNEIMARNNGAVSALLLNNNGGNIGMAIAGGSVGVGTPSPSAKLDVYSSNYSTAAIRSSNGSVRLRLEKGNSDSTASIQFFDRNTSLSWEIKQKAFGPGTDDLVIGNGGSSGIVLARSNNNVGIGTGTPWYKLDVAGTINSTGLNINSGTVYLSGAGIGQPVSGYIFTADALGNGSWKKPSNTGSGVPKRIAFWKDSTTISSIGNLFWDTTNFRLGIGSSAPATTLDVNGNVRILSIGGPLPTGKLGIGVSNVSHMLEISQDDAFKPLTSTWTIASDAQLKKNISDFKDGLNIIEKIHPVWFSYTGEAGMPVNEQAVGTLAQELEKIAPYMIRNWTYESNTGEKKDYLGINYGAMDFILINGIKDLALQLEEKNNLIHQQQKDITDLKLKYSLLENTLNQCCTYFQGEVSREYGIMQKPDRAFLEQNSPNPFFQTTIIKFYLPIETVQANIKIYAMDGTEMISIPVYTKGFGKVEVSAKTLSPGVYAYLLLADEKVVDTRQMILSK